jgi:hypothetical protein
MHHKNAHLQSKQNVIKPRFDANMLLLGLATSNPKWKLQLSHIHSKILSTMQRLPNQCAPILQDKPNNKSLKVASIVIF